MLNINILSQRLAISHINNLPDDFLPSLGIGYLARFYRFIYSSPLEEVIIYKSATCIITKEASSLWKRAMIHTLPFFLFAIILKVLNKKFWKYLCGYKEYSNPSPQIAFMFSNELGKGHGSELLKNCNLSPLYVKTLKGGKAESFYKKNGFTEYDSFECLRRKYIMLIRH